MSARRWSRILLTLALLSAVVPAGAQLTFATRTLPQPGHFYTNSLATDGTYLYFLREDGRLWRSASGDTGTWAELAQAPGTAPNIYSNALAYTGGKLYTYRSDGTHNVITIYDIASNSWSQRGLRAFGSHGFVIVNNRLFGIAHAIDTNQGGPITRANLAQLDNYTCERSGIWQYLSGRDRNWFSRVGQLAVVSNFIYGTKNDWSNGGTPEDGDRIYRFNPTVYSPSVWQGQPGVDPFHLYWSTVPQTTAIDLGNLPIEGGYGQCVVGLPPNWAAGGTTPLVGSAGGLFVVFGQVDGNHEGAGTPGDDYGIFNLIDRTWRLGKLPGFSSSGTAATYFAGQVWIKRGCSDPGSPNVGPNADLWVTTPAQTAPPVANAGPDRVVTLGQCDAPTVTLDGSASTDDVGIVRYRWLRGTTLLSDGPSPTATVTLPLAGATLTLIVYDGEGQSSTDTVTITFSYPPLAPPVAHAGPDQNVTTTPDGIVTLDGSASLSACDLTYRWVDTGSGTTLAVTAAPVVQVQLAPGTRTVQLTVTDVRGQTASDTVVITVTYGPVPVDDVWGPFGIKHGDITGTSRHPHVLPAPPLEFQLVSQRTGLPDPCGNRQFVFDAFGNLYFVTWYGSLKCLKPDLADRWETADLIGNTAENNMIVVGTRYVYLCGAEQGTNIGKVFALNKLDGSPAAAWPNVGTAGIELRDGGFTEVWDPPSNAAGLMTLYHDKLYVLGVPGQTANSLDPIRLYQINATTGVIERVSTLHVGATRARGGHLLLVPNLYGPDTHGLFWASASESGTDGLSDAVAIQVNPAGPATLVWGVDAGAAEDYSRLLYSSAGGRDAIYAITLFNWGNRQFWSFDRQLGLLDSAGSTYASGHRGESAALSQDGLSVYAGGDYGRMYRYTPDATGANTLVEDYWFGTDEYDVRSLAPRTISFATADGREVLVTGRVEYRGGAPDPNDPANDRRDINAVVALDVTNPPQGPTEADLDDGPLYIDDVQVRRNGVLLFGDDFQSYPVGTLTLPNAKWTYTGDAGAPAPQIVQEGANKALVLNPFGGNSFQYVALKAVLTLPDPQDGDVYVIRWRQKRVDLTDNGGLNTAPGVPGGAGPLGVFEWDGAGNPAGQRAYGTGADPDFSPSATLMVGAWQQGELTYTYDLFIGLATQDFTLDGTNGGEGVSVFDPSRRLDGAEFWFQATPPTSSGYVRVPEVPLAEYAASVILSPVTGERDWDTVEGLSVGPGGDIYFMQFKGYARRYTRLRLVGSGPTLCAGDLDCSGLVDFDDIDRFVEALGYPGGVDWPHACPWLNGDCNGDGNVNFDDIDPFVARIGASCP